ncbi:hypothetical protein BJ875DRAFT_444151 [Amylocarpus encephaloides]|uniref:Uncharacterized protein n=1 Tax=Amylocarpus encephaloides TaxID=45428 RepID=A0A9P8C2E0_9HELO|nr:hypothetical protein BJ875DRAFT_444151 [Amylocarpus encephaloides]
MAGSRVAPEAPPEALRMYVLIAEALSAKTAQTLSLVDGMGSFKIVTYTPQLLKRRDSLTMANAPASSPPKITFMLSIPGERDPIPVRAALHGVDLSEGSHYDDLLTAFRGISPAERRGITNALLLVEMEETAQETLNEIGETLDQSVKSWNLDPYHQSRLREPDCDLLQPDCFFSHHVDTKSRVILRLTAKNIELARVRRLPDPERKQLVGIFDKLPLHRQISDWIERWDKRTDQNAASKRQLTTESLNQETRPSYTEDRTQLAGISNQMQALPAITSLYLELPTIYPNQLSRPTQQVTLHQPIHQASPIAPVTRPSYYQDSKHSTSRPLEGHQQLVHEQQQLYSFEEGIEHMWPDYMEEFL